MLAQQYCEIITDSIRQIVDIETVKLRNNIEQMRTGTIKYKQNGEYTISYNNDTETVRVAIDKHNDNYSVGDTVYFTKNLGADIGTIQGKALADNEVPVKQLHEYNDFVKVEERTLTWVKVGDIVHVFPYWLLNSSQQKYTRLGITGTFCSEPGTEFSINIGIKANNQKYQYQLTPKDLIGTFYGLNNIPMLQKFTFALQFDNIQEITWSYSNTDFDNNQASLTFTLGYDLETLIEREGNGLILNIDDEAQLNYKTKYTLGKLDYDTIDGSNFPETGTRVLNLKWLQHDENNNKAYTQLNAFDLPLGITIKWYRYDAEYTGGDNIAGIGWRNFASYIVTEDQASIDSWLTQCITLPLDKPTDKFKAAFLLGADNYIVSNELTFTNNQPNIEELVKNYNIFSSDFRNGVINLYGWDNKLKSDYQYMANKVYELELSPNRLQEGLTLEELDEQIVSIQWKVPSTLFTIPDSVEKPEPEDEPPEYLGYTKSYDNGYWVITIQKRASNYYKIDEGTETEKSVWQGYWPDILPFKLVTTRTPDITQIISCDILLANGDTHHAETSFTMQTADGIMGTNNFVITHLYDSNWNEVSALEAGKKPDYYITLEVFDSSSQQPISQTNDIQCEWRPTRGGKDDQGKLDLIKSIQLGFNGNSDNSNWRSSIQLSDEGATKVIIRIWNDVTDISFDHLYSRVLTIKNLSMPTINNHTIQFTYHLPLAVKAANSEILYQGPVRLYYDTAGHFINNNSISGYPLKLEGLSDVTWELLVGRNSDNEPELGYPTLQEPNLVPSPKLQSYFENSYYNFWLQNGENGPKYTVPYCLLLCYSNENNTLQYIQPLIFERVTGFSTYLNDWDGSLTIDEHKNYILSSVLVAGHKRDGGFTGMIAGEVGNIIDNDNTTQDLYCHTGIFGYNNGTTVYALKDNGSLILGATGNGQITIDGDKGYIMSGNYALENWEPEYDPKGNLTERTIDYLKDSPSGTFFDLVNGKLFTGDGYFRGHIEGSTININDRFIVDKDGYMTTKAEIRSNLLAGTSDEWWTHTFPSQATQVHLIKWKHSQTPPFAWVNKAELLSKMTSDKVIYLGVSFDYEYIAHNTTTQPYIKIQGYYDIMENGTLKPFYYSLKDSVPLIPHSTTYQCKMVCNNEAIKNNTYIEDIHLFVYDAAPGDTLKIRNLKVEYLPSMDTRELSPWTPGVNATEVGLIQDDKLTGYVKNSDNGQGASWQLTKDGFYIAVGGGNSASLENYVFKVDERGLDIQGNATITGTVYTQGGSIGDWILKKQLTGQGGSTLYSYNDTTFMGLFTNFQGIPQLDGTIQSGEVAVGQSDAKNNWRILLGKGGIYNFGVDGDGLLYATGANLTGAIYATEGKIGSSTSGFEIDEDALGSYNTQVDGEVIGTKISTINGIVTSNIRANTIKLRAGVTTDFSSSINVGNIYLIWPCSGYNETSSEQYYGALTSQGIAIIYQDTAKQWHEQVQVQWKTPSN